MSDSLSKRFVVTDSRLLQSVEPRGERAHSTISLTSKNSPCPSALSRTVSTPPPIALREIFFRFFFPLNACTSAKYVSRPLINHASYRGYIINSSEHVTRCIVLQFPRRRNALFDINRDRIENSAVGTRARESLQSPRSNDCRSRKPFKEQRPIGFLGLKCTGKKKKSVQI